MKKVVSKISYIIAAGLSIGFTIGFFMVLFTAVISVLQHSIAKYGAWYLTLVVLFMLLIIAILANALTSSHQ